MLVMGSMIGSSIFIGLSIMAQSVQAPGLLIGLWIFAGLFTMLGAIAFAELAAMFPHTGGQYVYLREAFGNFVAFLFGWTQFLVIQTGTNAAVAIAFAKYLGTLVPRLARRQSPGDNSQARCCPAPCTLRKAVCLKRPCIGKSTRRNLWLAGLSVC